MCVPLSARRSVCPYVTSRYCIETTGRIELIVGIGLPSTDPTLCYKEICVSPKISVLPSGTLSQTSDLENFATASRSRCQQLVVVVDDGRACWRRLYDNQRVVAVYYTSINCNPLTPFDLLWICRITCSYSWQDFDWHSVARSVCSSTASCLKTDNHTIRYEMLF